MQKFWFRKPGVGWTSVPLPSSIGHSVVAPGLSPQISGLEEAGIWSQGSFSKSSSWLSHHFPTVNTFAQVKPLLLSAASLRHHPPLARQTFSYNSASVSYEDAHSRSSKRTKMSHPLGTWRAGQVDMIREAPSVSPVCGCLGYVSLTQHWLLIKACYLWMKMKRTIHQPPPNVRFSCLDFVLREERTGPDLNQTLT